MMEWYRRYVGTCADEKLAEAAIVAEAPRCLVIATWDALLESACHDEAGGAYSTTARRIGAVLLEPADKIAGVLAGMTEVGLIADGAIVAWNRRQPNSETPANVAERQRKSRLLRRSNGSDPDPGGGSIPPSQPVTDSHGVSRHVTPPEEEEETEIDSSPPPPARDEKNPGENQSGYDRPNVVPLPAPPAAGSLLEAECRAVMGDLLSRVRGDFAVISGLGAPRAQVLAGFEDARARGFGRRAGPPWRPG
jgi:hypothetical protein